MSKKLDPEERIRRKKARDRTSYLRRYDENRKRLRTYDEVWRKENPEKSRAINKRFQDNLRMTVIMAYGGKCACCGLDDLPFLSIDHINNDGNEHRRKLGHRGSRAMYAWLKANGFPTGIQVLCFNCNLAKAHHGGECPHQTRLREAQSQSAS